MRTTIAAVPDYGAYGRNFAFWMTVFLLTADQFFFPELNSIICLIFVVTWVLVSRKFFPIEPFKILVPYVLLVMLGIFSAFVNGNYSYSLLQDFWYYLKPILYFLTGYYIAIKTKSLRFLIGALVIASIIVSIKHLFNFILNPALLSSQVAEIREEAGKSMYIVPIALALVIYSIFSKERILQVNRYLVIICVALNSMSIFLTFSRTMLLVFFTILISLFGLFNLKGLGFWRLGLLLIGTVGFYFGSVMLLNYVETGPLGTLLLKIERAPSEVMIDESYLDKKDTFIHWRGYEAAVTLAQYWKGEWWQQLFGQGLGSMIDIGFYTQLGENYRRFIPRIHNAYAEILFKTGILGVVLYLAFIIRLILSPSKSIHTNQERIIRRTIMGIGLSTLFATTFVAGFLNKSSFDPVVVLLGMACGLVYVMKNHKVFIHRS